MLQAAKAVKAVKMVDFERNAVKAVKSYHFSTIRLLGEGRGRGGGGGGGLKAAIPYQFYIFTCKKLEKDHFYGEISCILKFRYSGHPVLCCQFSFL